MTQAVEAGKARLYFSAMRLVLQQVGLPSRAVGIPTRLPRVINKTSIMIFFLFTITLTNQSEDFPVNLFIFF